MLWYEKLRSVLERAGLKAHPYDKCYYTGEFVNLFWGLVLNCLLN